jgi:phasin family protein
MENTYAKLVEPIIELNKLTLKSIEQITAVQLKAIQDNTKIGLYALNTANEIKDANSFKNYMESQIAVSQYITDNAVVDAKEITELGNTLAVDAKEVVEKSIAS